MPQNDILRTLFPEAFEGEVAPDTVGQAKDTVAAGILRDLFPEQYEPQPEQEPTPVSTKVTQEPKPSNVWDLRAFDMGYRRGGYERQVEEALKKGEKPPEVDQAGRLLNQFMYGTVDALALGVPSAVGAGEEIAPQNEAERIARSVGHLVGFLGTPMKLGEAATTAVLKRVGKGAIDVGYKKTLELFTKIFGSKIGKAVLEGIPLAVASGIVLDERTHENLMKLKEGGLVDELQNRLEAIAWGQLVGTRFSWVAQTFDKFLVRAAVNVAVTQATNIAVNAAQGNPDLLPPPSELVYQSLLDVYFSRHRTLTQEEIQRINEKRQEIKEFSEWLSKTLELDRTFEEIKNKVLRDPQSGGQEPKGAQKSVIPETKRREDDPVVYLTSEEVAKLTGKKAPEESLDLGNNVKYSVGYDNVVKELREVTAKVESEKGVFRKTYEARKRALEYLKNFIEERALIGRDEADIWYEYWKQYREVFGHIDPAGIVGSLELIRAFADNLGVSPDIFLRKAPGGKFVRELPPDRVPNDVKYTVIKGDKGIELKVEFSNTSYSKTVVIDPDTYAIIGESYNLGAKPTESMRKTLDRAVDRVLLDEEVLQDIKKGVEKVKAGDVVGAIGEPPTIAFGDLAFYIPLGSGDVFRGSIRAHPGAPSVDIAMHETFHAIDDFFKHVTGSNLRFALNNAINAEGAKVDASKTGMVFDPLAELFVNAFSTGYARNKQSDPFLRRHRRLFGEFAKTFIEDAVTTTYFFFENPGEALKVYSVVEQVLGPPIAKKIWRNVRERVNLYNAERKLTDPIVRANTGSADPVKRARSLVYKLVRRAVRIRKVSELVSKRSAKDLSRLRKELSDMMALQQRDIATLQYLLNTPVVFDGREVRIIFPDEFNKMKSEDYTKIRALLWKRTEVSEHGLAVLDFLEALTKPGASQTDVIAAWNNLFTTLSQEYKPAPGDKEITALLYKMKSPLFSIEAAKTMWDAITSGRPVDDLLAIYASGIQHETNAIYSKPYTSVLSETVRYFRERADRYEPTPDAEVLITRVPDPEDINRLAEWVLTPEYALRNFPEAQSQVVKLIEAHLVHFRTVERAKLFFRDTLRFISKSEYPTLRKAIQDAYRLDTETLKSMYGDRIATAAEKLRDWFKAVKEEIKDHMKDVVFEELSDQSRELFEKLVNESKSSKEFAKKLLKELLELQQQDLDVALNDYELGIKDLFKGRTDKEYKEISTTVRKAFDALREAAKGENLDSKKLKALLNDIRKDYAKFDVWKAKLEPSAASELADLVLVLDKLPTQNKLMTEIKRLMKDVLRRNNTRFKDRIDKILDPKNNMFAVKNRRRTLTGQRAKIAKELIQAWNKLTDIENWGVWDYVTRIELGTYKVVNDEGHIIAIRPTEAAARRTIEEYRKAGLIGKNEHVSIVNEYSKVDPMEPRKVEGLQGDPDLLKALDAYAYHVYKRLIVLPTIHEVSRYIRVADVNLFPPNVRRLINGVIRSLRGQYYFADQVVDKFASKHGLQMFAFSRAVNAARKIEAAAKLGWRVGAFLVNTTFGYGHTWVKTTTPLFIKAFKWMRTPEGQRFLEQEEKYIGIGFAEAEGGASFVSLMKKFHPLWMYSSAELHIRRHSLATNYLYAKEVLKLPEADAREFARKGVRVQQFLYTLPALPRLFRGPTGRLVLQFKSYMVQEAQFLTTLTPTEWVKYITLQLAFGGPQAALHFLHSLPFLDSFGLLDKIERGLQALKFPENWPIVGGKPVAFGLYGLLGFDISMAAAVQLPGKVEEWFGAFIADAIKWYRVVVDSINNGVRYATGAGKINDTISGIQWALDNVGRSVVIANYWSNALRAFTTLENGDVWFRDPRDGSKMYPLRGYQDVALMLFGLKPVQKAQFQSLLNTWFREQERKEKKRAKILDQAVWYLTKGKPWPEELVEDMYTYGLTPQGILNAWQSAELDPETRRLMLARYIDRINVQERLFLRQLWNDYLEAQQP